MSGTMWGRHQTGQGKASDPTVTAETRHLSLAFERTVPQELRWASQHTNHWEGRDGKGQAKSSEVPKTKAGPCQSGIYCLLLPTFGPSRGSN